MGNAGKNSVVMIRLTTQVLRQQANVWQSSQPINLLTVRSANEGL